MMKWFYASGNEKRGPVEAAELAGLFREGVVTTETLVWREGMEQWQPYRSVAAEVGGGSAGEGGELVRCAYSGEMRAKGEMLQYGEYWVAAEHKDAFVQGLQQGQQVVGVETLGAMQYVGFWWRVLASIIDWFIKLVPNILFGIPYYIWFFGYFQEMMEEVSAGGDPAAMGSGMEPYMTWQYAFMVIGAVGFSMAYETWMVGRYGATVGKMALGFKIVNVDGAKVSYLKSFGRWWAEALVKLIMFVVGYIPFLIVMFSTGMMTMAPGQEPSPEQAMQVVVAMLAMAVLLPLGGFGYWMAGVTKQKKALHDVICKTRVVRKA